MRAFLWALAVVGCSASGDPCSGESGVCIGLHVVGSVSGLDQLSFTIDRPNTVAKQTPDPAHDFRLPVRVALFPPADTTGTVHVSCDATHGGALRAHGEVDAPLDHGHAQETLTLLATTTDDMALDLAFPDDADLYGLDLTGVVRGDGPLPDLAACAQVTACQDGDGCCPAGCDNTTDHDCPSVCGNKVVETGESCDDGNSLNGDGCDATCQWHGQMSTLSGVAGACGYADDPFSRFGAVGAMTTDGNTIWIADGKRIRMLAPNAVPGGGFQVGTFLGPEASVAPVGLAYVSGNQKLYASVYTDALHDASQLVQINPTNAAVSPIPTTVVQNSPTDLVSDGTTVFYVDISGGLNRWKPGDATSSQIVTSAAIGAALSNGSGCAGLTRSGGVSYLSCSGGIVQVADNGTVTSYAGTASPEPSCADNATKANAWFTSGARSALTVDGSGNLYDSSCYAVRKIASGVATVAGQLNVAGYADPGPGNTLGLFGKASSTTPIALLLVPAADPIVNNFETVFIGDADNCALRSFQTSFPLPQTIGGSSPALNAVDVRGSSTNSRYTVQSVPWNNGVVSDGTNLYVFGHSQTGLHPAALIKIDLATGTSTDLHTFADTTDMWGMTRIGNTIYVDFVDGVIRSVGTDGTNETIFAGDGSGSGTDNGTPGDLRSASLFATSITTDGTDLYFTDSGLVRKITLATSTVSLVAGTPGQSGVVDGVGGAAQFEFLTGITYTGGNLYVLDGTFGHQQVIRRIDLSTRDVKTIVGDATASNPVSADGVGLLGQVSGGSYMATDGRSLFISEATGFNSDDPLRAPTIRQLDLSNLSLTTLLGTRGQGTIRNLVGTKAAVHYPVSITFDAATHALYFFDAAEGVYQKIR
jgi:cysteine-rich repeat protein